MFRSSIRLRLSRSFQHRFVSSSPAGEAQKTAQNAYAAASRQAGDAFQRIKTFSQPLADRLAGMLGCKPSILSLERTYSRS